MKYSAKHLEQPDIPDGRVEVLLNGGVSLRELGKTGDGGGGSGFVAHKSPFSVPNLFRSFVRSRFMFCERRDRRPRWLHRLIADDFLQEV